MAHLIIGYLHNNLSTSQMDALHKWVCLSDKNMEIFEQLTLNADENVFNPDDVISDTESIIDLWMIAGLIVRHQKGMNNEPEESYLNEWINATKQNRKLFKKLQHPAYMQKMLVWNELKRQELLVF